MGHRKYSAPRRGSLAFRPRARAKSMEARVRNWPENGEEKLNLAGFAGFKAGVIHVLTVDDREKTPNYGKHLLNPCSVVVTPALRIIGIRVYAGNQYGKHVLFDVYSRDLPKGFPRKSGGESDGEKVGSLESKVDTGTSVMAIVAVSAHDVGLSQKKPYVFEIGVTGKDIKSRYEYLKDLLGKEVRVSDVFHAGENVDVSAITRGKGIEGPITRFGVKRKQHKSRKSVRALGTLGPISPAVVTYTVPRQGQRGFHQRTEYNKRIIMVSNSGTNDAINPSGGFKHFGQVRGDYVVVRGSIPGVPKRLIKLRLPIRDYQKKIIEPKIIEVIVQ
jgi:large subunit ribosomal protein L3